MRPIRSVIVALFAVTSISCAPTSPEAPARVMTVTEVIENIDALDGQRVDVAGYLTACGGYECRLFRNLNDKDQWDRHIEQITRDRSSTIGTPPLLGIGSGENFDFDTAAAALANSYVIITGTVTNRCRHRGMPACTDRSTDLQPEAVRRGQPVPAGGVGQ